MPLEVVRRHIATRSLSKVESGESIAYQDAQLKEYLRQAGLNETASSPRSEKKLKYLMVPDVT